MTNPPNRKSSSIAFVLLGLGGFVVAACTVEAPEETANIGQVASAQTGCQFFPETKLQACGRLLEFWNTNGGLAVFGFPIRPQGWESVEGRSVEVQWFERNRLELHPENSAPYDVLLGRLGDQMLRRRGIDWRNFPKASPSAFDYFPETGHAISPVFKGYWSSHGLNNDGQAGTSFGESLALFGLPLSEAQLETRPDGRSLLVQHFERARFEAHPENVAQPEYLVLLGLLGAETKGGYCHYTCPDGRTQVYGVRDCNLCPAQLNGCTYNGTCNDGP